MGLARQDEHPLCGDREQSFCSAIPSEQRSDRQTCARGCLSFPRRPGAGCAGWRKRFGQDDVFEQEFSSRTRKQYAGCPKGHLSSRNGLVSSGALAFLFVKITQAQLGDADPVGPEGFPNQLAAHADTRIIIALLDVAREIRHRRFLPARGSVLCDELVFMRMA